MHDDASKVGESEPSTQCETLNINQAVQDTEDQQETGHSEPNLPQISRKQELQYYIYI